MCSRKTRADRARRRGVCRNPFKPNNPPTRELTYLRFHLFLSIAARIAIDYVKCQRRFVCLYAARRSAAIFTMLVGMQSTETTLATDDACPRLAFQIDVRVR